jgi:hypothetical protein
MAATTIHDPSLSMDPSLTLETRRLLISTTLSANLRRRLGRRVPAGSDPGKLLDVARGLNEVAEPVERVHLLRFDLPYPGVTAGPESVGNSCRRAGACRVSDHEGSAIGVAFTTLIAGRPPQVSVAPPQASIPEAWQPFQ